MNIEFAGNIVALVTPFRNGSVDQKALRSCVDRVIEGGVSGLVPCGTTGESPTLTHEEHDQVVAMTVEAAAGRVPVIAGAGSNSTSEAVRLTRAAAKAGAKAVLSVNPYYNRPSQTGLVQHFLAIAEASDIPVVHYNIPSRCGVELSVDTITKLAEHPKIQAIKEATGNVENVTRLRATTNLAILAGDDALTLPMMALGARGVVSVLSNLMPAGMTRLVRAAAAGEFGAALAEHDRLHPLMKALFLETNPVPVKEAMAQLGWILPELRAPLCPMSFNHREQMERVMAQFAEELR